MSNVINLSKNVLTKKYYLKFISENEVVFLCSISISIIKLQ